MVMRAVLGVVLGLVGVAVCRADAVVPAPVPVPRLAPVTPVIRVAPVPPWVSAACTAGSIITALPREAVAECVQGTRVLPLQSPVAPPALPEVTPRDVDPPALDWRRLSPSPELRLEESAPRPQALPAPPSLEEDVRLRLRRDPVPRIEIWLSPPE